MRQSAAVLCQDKQSLLTLKATLAKLDIEMVPCHSSQEALELVLTGCSSTLIVDFDLPGAEEAIRMAALLPPSQKPALLAVASRMWPGTGEAFQSGANRILYRPLESEQLKDALKIDKKTIDKKSGKSTRRKTDRYEMKTLVYLDFAGGTVSGISIDIGEHGLAVQATDPVPVNSNVPFRCVLPGTDITLHGHADVIWASDMGRAGLFFSKVSPAARKHLKHWLSGRSAHTRKKDTRKERDFMLPQDANVEYATSE